MRVKYYRYDKCIKGYKNLSIDLAKEGIASEQGHQKLLWNILENPTVIKYVRRNMLKQENKKELQ